MRGERGQATVEWLVVSAAVLALTGLLALRAGDLARTITGAFGETVCAVDGDACAPASDTQAAASQAPPPSSRAAWYRAFVAAGERGALLNEIDTPSDAEFDALVARRDISLYGGRESRRYFRVPPQPGRGIVAFDFFIPDANTTGLHGDGRPETGTNVLRSDLPITRSRVMIVIDFETGRAVITQSETRTDLNIPGTDIPLAPDSANEPRPIALNGDRGSWSHESGLDFDETNQINLQSTGDGLHVDWDLLNSITPFAISVDGDVDFTEGEDGFLQTGDLGNQGNVDRYPQIQVWQYLPDGREREIGRNDYQGGHFPVQGAMPHADLPDLPDLPNLPKLPLGGPDLPDLPNLPNLPSVPCPWCD